MHKALVWFLLLLTFGCVGVFRGAVSFSDTPEYPRDPTVVFKTANSYDQALKQWNSPEDVNAWIAANFRYDITRALRLSETRKAQQEKISIYFPSELFETKTGICVDLSRFGVETLREIAPDSDPWYLMIEFDPINLEGNVLRLHWLVRFMRDGKMYFFADSKRPGYIAGPYNSVVEFIREYEKYRGRKIVAFRELKSYKKQKKRKTQKRKTSRQP